MGFQIVKKAGLRDIYANVLYMKGHICTRAHTHLQIVKVTCNRTNFYTDVQMHICTHIIGCSDKNVRPAFESGSNEREKC